MCKMFDIELSIFFLSQKCGGELILGTGALASPGYPSFYSINTVCQWFINGKPCQFTTMVKLSFYLRLIDRF